MLPFIPASIMNIFFFTIVHSIGALKFKKPLIAGILLTIFQSNIAKCKTENRNEEIGIYV